MTPREVLAAALGADVLVRIVLATALQVGVSAGVFVMIELQRKVAIQDDEVVRWRTVSSGHGASASRSSSSPRWACT